MKPSRITTLLLLSVLAALLLSACTGGTVYNTWPGLSTGNGVVYLAYINGVFAVQNGTMLWRFPEKPDNAKAFYAPPHLPGEAGGAAGGSLLVADYANNLYALNPQSGATSWQFAGAEPAGGHFVAAPLVVGETVLAPSSNHYLYALDPNGKEIWSFRTANMLWAQPASDGQTIYLPAMDHNLYALGVADGALAWKKDLGSALTSSPVLGDDGSLFVSALNGDVFALDVQNGAVRWQGKVSGEVWAGPVLVDDTLYLGSSNGRVYLLSAADGTVIKETDLGSPVIGGGALFGEAVVFPTEGGTLYAIDAEGQTTAWKPTVNGKLYTTPVVVDDKLVVAIKDGDKILAAFDQNGAEAWSFTTPK